MPLPVLTRIVESPVFGSDGTLQTDPGYHPASRTLCIAKSGFQVPPVSQQASAEEVRQARSLFCDDLLVDFPFVDNAERAHALAPLLLPFARDLIAGAPPLHLFEKPSPGTGATLLVDMLSYTATGRPIPTMTEVRDEEEWRKRLTAKLRTSPQLLLVDNLKHKLDSGALAAAITSTKWEDRLLGQSVTLRMHVRCAWLATGNNPVVSSEMARRIIRIRLDAKMDRPWLRKEFKHDLRDCSRRNCDRLAWAALTLIRAWIAAGRPLGSLKLGMFEDWSQVMGGILHVADIPGFLSNLADFYNESDAEGRSGARSQQPGGVSIKTSRPMPRTCSASLATISRCRWARAQITAARSVSDSCSSRRAARSSKSKPQRGSLRKRSASVSGAATRRGTPSRGIRKRWIARRRAAR